MRALLGEVGRVYAPFLLANARALARGAEHVECTIDGRPWVQQPFPYQGKCLRALRDGRAALAGAERARVDARARGHGLRALVREGDDEVKLGIGAVGFGPKVNIDLERIRHAESLGFDSAWTAEAYGNDAVSTAAWVLAQTTRLKVGTAIMQMPARTPAMAAMTAMTLDQLSGGRFMLGLGPSGPQVVEGWHGVPTASRWRARASTSRSCADLRARGAARVPRPSITRCPYTGAGTTGLGKPLKSILHGDPKHPDLHRVDQPAGLRCAAEVADGVFPMIGGTGEVRLGRTAAPRGGLREGGQRQEPRNFAVVPGVQR